MGIPLIFENERNRMKLVALFSVLIAPIMLWSAELKNVDLEHSTISMRRYITNDVAMEKLYGPDAAYIEGNAFFYRSNSKLVTVMHNIEGMCITTNTWTELELFQCYSKGGSTIQKNKVRIVFSKKFDNDGIAVLGLESPFKGAYPLEISEESPQRGEWVQCIGYVSHKVRRGKGKLIGRELSILDGGFTPTLFEFDIESATDTAPIDLGCSGAPFTNARGEVVAVLKSVTTMTIGVGKDSFRTVPIGATSCKGIPVSVLRKH